PGANRLTVSGKNTSRVFNINLGSTVTVSGVAISNGRAPDGGEGGGILNHGILTLTNSVISDNAAQSAGGGVYSFGELAVIDSTISRNTANYSGGGISANGFVSVARSTINGNSCTGRGGGLYLLIPPQSIVNRTLINTTISGNTSSGGALYVGGTEGSTSVLQVTNCTIVNNSGSGVYGGGIIAQRLHSSTTIAIRNTIIANNTTPNLQTFGDATLTSRGYNLTSDNSSTFLNQPTDQVNTDPLLMTLADNGG